MRIVSTSLVLALVLGAAAPARADDEPWQAARAHYERGVELANHGEYKPALEAFDAAYAASPHFAVLYNIGQAQVALGRPQKAIEAFKRYLADGKDQVPAPRRQQVEAQIALLESLFADLIVTTEPEGAEVTVDGRDVGKTPLAAAMRVGAGTHVVSATRAGALPASRVVTLGEGDRQVIALALAPTPEGVLALQCWEPGVRASLDGQPLDSNKAALGVGVGPGRHRVAFSAPGKSWPEQGLEVPAGVRAIVFCGTVPPQRTGEQPGSTGPVVTHAPFPTGYLLMGAGVAVGGVALAHYLWNAGRRDDFRANEAALRSDPSPGRTERQVANNALADSINRASVVTVGLALSAGALAAGGTVWLVMSAPRASERERSAQLGWRGVW